MGKFVEEFTRGNQSYFFVTMTIIIFVLLALLIFVYVNSKEFLCKSCSATTFGKPKIFGSGGFEICLWLISFSLGHVFAHIGLICMALVFIYAICKRRFRYKSCEFCGSKELVDLYSPVATENMEKEPEE